MITAIPSSVTIRHRSGLNEPCIDSRIVGAQILSLLLLRSGDHQQEFSIPACIPYFSLRIVVEDKANSSLLHQKQPFLRRRRL